jgi:Flp pilus assembly protein TadG
MKGKDNAKMSWQGQRGAAAVEGAVVVMVFLVVILAIFEAGRFFNVQQVLTNASREGARLAVMPLSGTSTLPTTGQIESEVQRFLQAANIQGATIAVNRPVFIDTGGVQTEFTRVVVSLPYQVLTLSMFSVLEISLVGEALMRNETSP